MTSNLVWMQTAVPTSHGLSDELKFALREEYGESIRVDMSTGDLPYLRGLQDGGLKEAKKLIDAIHKHTNIRVWENFG